MVDLYNLFNANAAIDEDDRLEQGFAPLAIVNGRLVKLGVQIDLVGRRND